MSPQARTGIFFFDITFNSASISLTNDSIQEAMSSTKSQTQFSHILQTEIDSIKAAGTYKSERVIVSPQHSDIRVAGKDGEITPQINFCANNYLGILRDLKIRFVNSLQDVLSENELCLVSRSCGSP